MAGYYLCNTVPAVNTASGPLLFAAGTLVTDSSIQAALRAAGGLLAPQSDAAVAAAAVIAQGARLNKGADGQFLTNVMMAAYAGSAAAGTASFTLRNGTQLLGATATVEMVPDPVPKAATILTATFSCPTAAATGESAVLQFKKNGSSISGATLTYNSSSSPDTLINVPNLAGVALVAGDQLTYDITYTAGGTPALSGAAGDHTVTVVAQ